MDRNTLDDRPVIIICKSLSARRAWIEMLNSAILRLEHLVALRKESVDRNHSCPNLEKHFRGSLSARRAWIEIIDYVIDYATDAGRSPQGERG